MRFVIALVVSVLASILVSNAHAADVSTIPPAIVLTSPQDYQVFQRDNRSKGTATISGRLSLDAKARFRWRGKSINGDVPEQWNELPVAAGAHGFSLTVTVPAGGWYRLELQAYTENIVRAQTQVAHVGVGEVFVVAGQSNSTNYGTERLVPETGLVASFDGRAWGLAKDPQGGCDGSGGGSFIPAFGDALAKKYRVPIGVASTGQGATSVRQWLPQGVRVKQQPTTGGMKQVGPGEWESNGSLFNRLVQRIALLGPKGFRAVLWHQGESDAGQARAGYPADRQITGEQYFQFMGILIRAAQEKAGWPVPWFTAQATYHVGDPADAEFRAAMKKLWDKGVSLEGPDTDTLGEVYRSGVHFNGKGQREHGRLWAEKVGAYLDSELAKPAQSSHAQPQPIHFEPTLESLKQYTVPECFEDAKFGIWAHWGPHGSTDIPYATALDWPGNGATLTIGSVTADRIDASNIASIEMLGSSETLAWKQDAKGLHVVMPAKAPRSLYAFSLKIRLKTRENVFALKSAGDRLKPAPKPEQSAETIVVRPARDDAMLLNPGKGYVQYYDLIFVRVAAIAARVPES